jgi:hypothetical protein
MSGSFETDNPSESNHLQHIEINLLSDFVEELKVEFNQNRWGFEEGFYYVLAAGLAALKNARQPQSISQDESMVIDQLQAERIRMYGRYAAMKHQVAKLLQEVKSLEVQLKATQSLWNALRKQSLIDERKD